MAADGSVVFSIAADDADARKKLQSLEKEINSIEKSLNKNVDKRTGIEQSLSEAKNQAEETAARIRAIKSEMGDYNDILRGKGRGEITVDQFNQRKARQAELTAELANQEALYAKQTATVDKLEKSEKGVQTTIDGQTQSLETLKGQAGELTQRLSYTKKSFNLKEKIDQASAAFKKGLKNILKWGFGIRSVFILVRRLRAAIKEGITNFAKVDPETEKSLNALKASLASVKTSWGAAFAPIINTVAPLLQNLMSMLQAAADKVNMFFSALSGRGTYKRAVTDQKALAKSYGKTGGAANDAGKQILGFDEITKLDDKSGGGGGGGGDVADYTKAVEEELPDFFKRLKDAFTEGDFKEIGSLISEKLKDGLDNAIEKIKNFDFEKFAKTIFSNIGSFFDGFDIGSVTNKLSTWVAEAINGLADFINGATDSGFINSLTNFISRAIGGIDLGALLNAITNLAVTIFANLPVIFLELVGGLSDILAGIFEALGLDSVAGFFRGISDKIREAAKWLKENFVDPIVKCVKDALGIHSPSKIFEDIGDDVIEGFLVGIKNAWNAVISFFTQIWTNLVTMATNMVTTLGNTFGRVSAIVSSKFTEIKNSITEKIEAAKEAVRNAIERIKEFFHFEWELPHIKMPHITVQWEAVNGNNPIAKLFGIGAIPHLGISWYARGGIVDGATLIGAGEAGKEAIVPLERNTEWINMVAKGIIDGLTANNTLADYISGRVLPSVVNGSIVPPRALSGGGSMFTDGDIQRLVNGLTAAFSADGNDQSIKLYLDGKQIAETVTRHQRRMERGYA